MTPLLAVLEVELVVPPFTRRTGSVSGNANGLYTGYTGYAGYTAPTARVPHLLWRHSLVAS
jgi:hypothetical protein